MKHLQKYAFTTFLLLASTGSTLADVWGTAGGWDILIDTSDRNVCFAKRTLNDGSTVFIGFEGSANGGYVAIYNPAWTHIEEDQASLVTFDFVKEKFAGEAVGKVKDGAPGAYASFNNPAFADAFARYETVQITGSKGATFSMSLTGTHKAVNAVRNCQDAQKTIAE